MAKKKSTKKKSTKKKAAKKKAAKKKAVKQRAQREARRAARLEFPSDAGISLAVRAGMQTVLGGDLLGEEDPWEEGVDARFRELCTFTIRDELQSAGVAAWITRKIERARVRNPEADPGPVKNVVDYCAETCKRWAGRA